MNRAGDPGLLVCGWHCVGGAPRLTPGVCFALSTTAYAPSGVSSSCSRFLLQVLQELGEEVVECESRSLRHAVVGEILQVKILIQKLL